MFRVYFLASSLIAVAICAQLPSYIFKCTRDTVNKQCGPESANRALPELLKGDPELGIPSFFPFRLPHTSIKSSQLEVELDNTELEGFDTFRVTKTEGVFSWHTPTFAVEFEMDTLTLKGEFLDGTRAFGAPLPRSGKANFTLGQVSGRIEAKMRKQEQGNFEVTYVNEDISVKINRVGWKNWRLSEFWTGTPYVENDSETLSEVIIPKMEEALTLAYDAASRIFTVFTENTLYRSSLPPLPPLKPLISSYKSPAVEVNNYEQNNVASYDTQSQYDYSQYNNNQNQYDSNQNQYGSNQNQYDNSKYYPQQPATQEYQVDQY